MLHLNFVKTKFLLIFLCMAVCMALSAGLSTMFSMACSRQAAPALKRYPFTGRVVALDKAKQSAIIDGDAVPGFMTAMAMDYKIKAAADFSQLAAGDSISAEVVVEGKDQDSPTDYWLENVKVTRQAKPAGDKAAGPAAEMHIPSPGDQVPDFQFTNQNGKKVSLKQYRGQVLFVTFIYTRCPFPDFCPRVGAQFAQLNQRTANDAGLSRKTHLLCISFDSAHDTPGVLRDYGFSLVHSRQNALFERWEFVVPRVADLAQMASYFALTYKSEGGLITHSLSTAVIGPDGKIVSWYHGSEWQVSDLVKDAEEALQVQG